MTANTMSDRLNRLREQHKRDRESVDYKLEMTVLEITDNMLKRLEELHISRTELAERLGVTKAAVTRMLGGNTNFTLKRLLAVALALDCDKVSVSFPPIGFKTPEIFVSQATEKRANHDYRTDPFEHMKTLTIDSDERVA